MSDRAYKILGLFVWRAARLYLRQKVPSRRWFALSALAAIAAAAVLGVLMRRSTD